MKLDEIIVIKDKVE